MNDFIVSFFTDKNVFTYTILFLYMSNFIFQFTYTKDYVWGGYWLFAGGITLMALMMSNR